MVEISRFLRKALIAALLAGAAVAPVATAGAKAKPLFRYLLIADRGNNRLLVVDPAKRILWRFAGGGRVHNFAEPDDAFLSPNGRYISANSENYGVVYLITYTAHPRIVWRYGHFGRSGSAPGYLYHPDDAYLLPNGLLSVADIVNCRVIWIDRARRIVRQLGATGVCRHDPPRYLKLPNGDTPTPDGGTLVTEIGGWVDRFTASGRLLWSVRVPTSYPSDAQLLPDGNVLLAAYENPGHIYIVNPRTGRVVFSYGPARGPGRLNHPSIAVRLENGLIAATDDEDDRVVLIDPRTKRIVWSYGHRGRPGRAPGYLNTPDGLDPVSFVP